MEEKGQTSDRVREEVKNLLKAGDTQEASEIVRGVLTADNDSWPYIAVLSEFLTSEHSKTNRDVFECCKALVEDISEKCFPEEALLEFIEQAEDCDSVKFGVMLSAMRNCLSRLPPDRLLNPFEWCCNTVLRHVYDLPAPEDLKLEGEEFTVGDNSETVCNVSTVYSDIVNFFSPFLSRMRDNPKLRDPGLRCFLKLFGRPLAYTDLTPGKSNKSDCRIIAERLLDFINDSNVDLLQFLNFVNSSSGKDDSAQAFVDADYVNTSLGVFYYLIFHEGLYQEHISHVYSPVFLVFRLLALSQTLLCFSHSCVQKKGLLLAGSAVDRLADRSVCYAGINSHILSKFIESLGGIMIYSEVKENREIAVKVFRSVIFKLDDRGRYVMMANVQEVITQPGFIGYLATLMKDTIAESLASDRPSEYFRGKHLSSLLAKFCRLENGVETDLIELSDQVLSSLNLLRYLSLRDADNSTGFWDCVGWLESDFLEPLKKGLMLSRAHYELQKSILTSGGDDENNRVDVKIFQVAMPKEQKAQVLDLALNTFDLMESLLSRVNECIALGKST